MQMTKGRNLDYDYRNLEKLKDDLIIVDSMLDTLMHDIKFFDYLLNILTTEELGGKTYYEFEVNKLSDHLNEVQQQLGTNSLFV